MVPPMNAVEFTTVLRSDGWLHVPAEAAARLPKDGTFKVILLPAVDSDDSEWRDASCQQFMRDDSPADSIYDSLA